MAGAGGIVIDYGRGTLSCAGTTLKEGDAISINGSTGEVFAGGIATAYSELKQVLIAGTMKKLGICGEHGGDPHSVIFCHQLGLDYVSCSPFRLPVARLAAAQAALKE